jgi:hypothetical protein
VGLEHRGDRRVDGKAAEIPALRDAHATEVTPERASEALAGLLEGDRRPIVGPSHDQQHERDVLHRPSMGPETISGLHAASVGAGTRPGDGRRPTTLQ